MGESATKTADARGENINLRVSLGQKALIDRAAQALGRNRSEFMLETACREAESVASDNSDQPASDLRASSTVIISVIGSTGDGMNPHFW